MDTAISDADSETPKNHVTIKLIEIDDGKLITRSQAKTLLASFDRFVKVTLDFSCINGLGKGSPTNYSGFLKLNGQMWNLSPKMPNRT